MGKLLCGVGINDIKNSTSEPYYGRWGGMISRCYGGDNVNYQDKYVCDEWLRYSNFRAWMVDNYQDGMELDKDLLVYGNNVYSPDTCLMIPKSINNFLTIKKSNASSGLPLGVTIRGRKPKKQNCNMYQSSCKVNNKNKHLGYFKTPEEAHHAWLIEKHRICSEFMELYDDDNPVFVGLGRVRDRLWEHIERGEILTGKL